MHYTLPALLVLGACGPDAEQLERIVRLEVAVEALQVEVGTLQEGAAKQQQAAEGPVKCAQAKKVAFDAWEELYVSAYTTAGCNLLTAMLYDQGKIKCVWRKAASGAKQAATGGAIKAKAAADYAATLHNAQRWDTTAAVAASAASWEVCKDVDP